MTTWLDLAQLMTGLIMTGLIWTVQLVVYPAFLHFSPEAFPNAHAAHSRRIGLIVGPLLLTEWSATIAWLTLFGGSLTHTQCGIVACVVIAFLSTFLIQVPLHHRLSRGWDERTIRMLVRTNWIRTLAWTAKGFLALLTVQRG